MAGHAPPAAHPGPHNSHRFDAKPAPKQQPIHAILSARPPRPSLSPHPSSHSNSSPTPSPPRQDRLPRLSASATSTSAAAPRRLQLLHTPNRRAPTTTTTTDNSPATPELLSPPAHSRPRRLSSSSTTSRPTPTTFSSPGSYFGPQSHSSAAEPRSPALRKPPASHSSNGTATSSGPPIALITRRRSNSAQPSRLSQSPSDAPLSRPNFALSPSPLDPPSATRHARHSSASTTRSGTVKGVEENASGSRPRSRARSSSAHSIGATSSASKSKQDMASATRYSRYHSQNTGAGAEDHSGDDATLQGPVSGFDEKGARSSSEDLFLTEAKREADGIERRRSRIARTTRLTMPGSSLPTAGARSASGPLKTPNSAIETRLPLHYRRTSNLPSPSIISPSAISQTQSPLTAPMGSDGSRYRTRTFGVSPQSSFTSSVRPRDHDEMTEKPYSGRRSSIPDTSRVAAPRHSYRPSNLHYTSRYPESVQAPDTPPESTVTLAKTPSGGDGTESAHSREDKPLSMREEMEHLKAHIKRLEQQRPSEEATQGVGDRPRTANTHNTSFSSSPKHSRKRSTSPTETAVSGAAAASHPLLHSALAKAKTHTLPSLFKVLEATASDALELAAMTGAGATRGNSIANGTSGPDRQLRRKADNMCRNLTELCIAVCDGIAGPTSPNLPRSPSLAVPPPRRGSAQANGVHHTARGASTEPDSDNPPPRNSPSRALTRIEQRRTSMAGTSYCSTNNSPRDYGSDRTTPTQQSNRPTRAGISLLRPRRATINNDYDDEDLPASRVPSRAATDFSQRSTSKAANRLSREYTSQVPLPELPVSAFQHATSLRRPNGVMATSERQGTGIPASTSLAGRRHVDRSTPPASEHHAVGSDSFTTGSEERRSRIGASSVNSSAASSFTSTGSAPRTTTGLSRVGSLSRRLQQGTS